jgi:hypothetical protein
MIALLCVLLVGLGRAIHLPALIVPFAFSPGIGTDDQIVGLY